MVAFSVHGIGTRGSLLTLVPVAAMSVLVSFWLTPHVPPNLLMPVRAYTLVISLMLVAAVGTRGRGGPVLIPVGATLFYLSDLSVAAMRFAEPVFPTYIWGLPFYYTGQVMLALSIGYINKRDELRNE
jgi:uncharacterized membrane protein YhhN